MKAYYPDHETEAYNMGKFQDYDAFDDYITKYKIKDRETLHDLCQFFDRGKNKEPMFDEE